ncbi:hypothetical protein L249_3542 [Ophiocordyceps polyrhachis-furcata BCC 54312]|uniref:Uncharacterized protein n=1 Tax=Ophiocordyceps polyrhachis-furcata BCC 54312 TaxID=1330021 RepID=A0A367LM41_9HYPO|nr:hypothetical protein L249_3542 [Ophiocordyceps polyrhachis-furcata BCC 54312]
MRFSLALAGVLAMAAKAVGTNPHPSSGPGHSSGSAPVDVKVDIMAKLGGINADLVAKVNGIKAVIDVDVGVDAKIKARVDAIKADVKVNVDGLKADVQAKIADAKVDVKALVADIKVKVGEINARIDAEVAGLDVKVKVKVAAVVAKIDADVKVKLGGLNLGVDVDVDVDVDANIADLVKIDGRVDLKATLAAGKSFHCPAGMSYCPWTKACACPAGQKLDVKSKKCVGRSITGAWPKPSADRYSTHGVRLGSYCAASPYRIVAYNAGHRYCQAGLDTITFVASADIALELAGLVDVDIDIDAHISAQLKAVVAGLVSLYLESSIDAVALFNTDAFGLGVDVSAHASVGILDDIFCAIGLGKCHVDCVSYCSKGCKNFIDVDADIGAGLQGLVGLAILPDVLLVVNSSKIVVSIAVNSLLCLLGGLLKSLVSSLGGHC